MRRLLLASTLLLLACDDGEASTSSTPAGTTQSTGHQPTSSSGETSSQGSTTTGADDATETTHSAEGEGSSTTTHGDPSTETGVPGGDASGATASPFADVLDVTATGLPMEYNVSVTVRSPDMGCEQYADWWEVLRPDGSLAYRRVLSHSHVGEQPFTRSGGPVPIAEDETVLVRAHMHPDGYGGIVLEGSLAAGFTEVDLDADFGADLEHADPQPPECAF